MDVPTLGVRDVLDVIADKKRWTPMSSADVRTSMEIQTSDYLAKAGAGQLHLVPSVMPPYGLKAKFVHTLYRDHFVPKESGGRKFYDLIMLSAPHGRCPYCGIAVADTLDHFLPKAYFPFLCVSPVNLIPSCTRCNGALLDGAPSDAASVPLNPYFDRLPEGVWLECVVTAGPTMVFRTCRPASWDSLLYTRMSNFFRAAKLGPAYAVAAGSTIVGLERQLNKFSSASDRYRFLEDEAGHAEHEEANSVRAATLRGLRDSQWFKAAGYVGLRGP